MMTFENVKFHEYLVCKSDNCHIALLFRTPGWTDQFDSFHEVGQRAGELGSNQHQDILQSRSLQPREHFKFGIKIFLRDLTFTRW